MNFVNKNLEIVMYSFLITLEKLNSYYISMSGQAQNPKIKFWTKNVKFPLFMV